MTPGPVPRTTPVITSIRSAAIYDQRRSATLSAAANQTSDDCRVYAYSAFLDSKTVETVLQSTFLSGRYSKCTLLARRAAMCNLSKNRLQKLAILSKRTRNPRPVGNKQQSPIHGKIRTQAHT